MEVFQDYAYYYNLFYNEKEYEREVNDLVKLITKHSCLNSQNILSLGCGTGKHDIELAKNGYSVDGVDISQNMIDIAKKTNPKSNYTVADIRDYISEQKYEVAVSLFHVISYQNTNSDILKAFTTANRALKLDGLFIFDAWYGPGVLSDLPSTRIKKVENRDVLAIRYARPIMHANTNIVDVNYEVIIINKKDNTVGSLMEEHNMRYVFKPEIEEYLY